MRRRLQEKKRAHNLRKLLYLSGGVLAIAVVSFIVTFVSYNNRLRASTENFSALEGLTGVISDNFDNIGFLELAEQTNADMGESITEVLNAMEEDPELVATNAPVVTEPEAQQEVVEAPPVVLDFMRPVDGEVVRRFAMNHLVFSPTLQEWITHPGVDIRAPRTTVVVAAEAGRVIGIRNDPRYGLTIIVEHANGYRTIYSNLLSAEFVSEGERVDRGQSLGTVGNSAAFEILDEPQLHFEILRDGVHVDPELYISF